MRKLTLLLFAVALSLVACASEPAPSGSSERAGDATAGAKVYNEAVPACGSCHSLDASVTLVGPSMATIGAEAASRVPGMSAEEYLRKAIIAPDEHVVEGFAKGLMPATYGSQLTQKQIDDLVAYLLTLK